MDNRSTQNRKLPQPRNNRPTPSSPRPKSSTDPRRDRRRGEQQQVGAAQQGLPVTNAAHKSLGARARIRNSFDYAVSEFKDKGFKMFRFREFILIVTFVVFAIYVMGGKIIPGFGESAFRRNTAMFVYFGSFIILCIYCVITPNNPIGTWVNSIRFGTALRKKKKGNKLSKSSDKGKGGKKLK